MLNDCESKCLLPYLDTAIHRKYLYLKAISLFLLLVSISGCVSYQNEVLMTDGRTWRIHVVHTTQCNGYTSVESCVTRLTPAVRARAEQLCGGPPSRLFGCSKIQGGNFGIMCYATCSAPPT